MTTKIKELFSQKKLYPCIEKKECSFINMQLIDDWSSIKKNARKICFSENSKISKISKSLFF